MFRNTQTQWGMGLGLSLLCVSCTGESQNGLNLAACPINQTVQVLSASFNQSQNQYSIFHTTAAGLEKLPNPLRMSNLQMMQMENPANTTGDVARLKFTANGKSSCEPVLEMTKGFKIDLTQGASGPQNANQSSSGSSWAPFLMGAVAGNLLSSTMRAPAYYLPPPAPANGGVVTGGVSASQPSELNKKYSQTYGQESKRGFFSKTTGTTADNSESQKSGFFNRKNSNQGSSSPKRSFFKKR